MTKAIGLIRLSTEEQAELGRGGLDRQREVLNDLAVSYGLEYAKIFEVIDVSGTDVLSSPEFVPVFAELQKQGIEGMALASVDRLIRPELYRDYGVFDYFAGGKKLWTLSQGMIDPDPSKGSGDIQALLSGRQAGNELAELKRRTMGAKERLRAAGQCPLPSHLLMKGVTFVRGKRGEKGVWQYVEPQASKVRKAYDMLFEGETLCDIDRFLGYKARCGAARRILTNPIWVGIRRYEWRCEGPKRRMGNGKMKRKSVKQETPREFKIDLEPLIPRERWDAAQILLLERNREYTKKQTKRGEEFLLNGIVRCTCGARMYVFPQIQDGTNQDRYFCSSARRGKSGKCPARSVRRDVLDPRFDELIAEALLRPVTIEKALREIAKRVEEPKPTVNVKAIGKQIAALELQQAKNCELALDGTFSKADFKRERIRIEAKLQELRGLLKQDANKPEQVSEWKKTAKQVVRLFATYPQMSFQKRRAFLHKAVRSVIVASNGTILTMTLHGGFLGSEAIHNNCSDWCGSTNVVNSGASDLTLTFSVN
jgi:DNA invertase Pin-like site-specific DNA recombinase